MQTKLFIPKRIKIGFRERKDTFTGKLAYVIYFDEKNKLRKQPSWDGWRDQSIEPIEYENNPQNGFILNKGVQRYSDWGSSRAVVRVYDSRDFEFEISIDNLLGILMHSDVSKRDIVEECVFAWSGSDLILLPCNSVEYQESVEYTEKQDMKVSTKELVPGRQYNKKKSDDILTYLGRFDWWEFKSLNSNRWGGDKIHTNKGKKHIFWDGATFRTTTPSILSSVVSEDIVQDYPFLLDNFFKTVNSQPIVDVKIIPYTKKVCDEKTYMEFPSLSNITDGKMNTISVRGYYVSSNCHDLTFTLYSKSFIYSDSIQTNVVQYPRQSYYDQYDTTKPITTEFTPTLQAETIKMGYSFVDLLPSQYLEIMTNLGYGEVRYVLKNGTELEVRNYYW